MEICLGTVKTFGPEFRLKDCIGNGGEAIQVHGPGDGSSGQRFSLGRVRLRVRPVVVRPSF